MKIIEVENSKIAAFLDYNITLYPFILYVGAPSERTRKHEMVHIAQIEKYGVFTFYRMYLLYYIANRFRGMSPYRAYMAIPFEIEAYQKENE